MGHYDQQYEDHYETLRDDFARRVEADAARLGVPVVSMSYTVIALCGGCGGKIYEIGDGFKGAGQVIPCGCR